MFRERIAWLGLLHLAADAVVLAVAFGLVVVARSQMPVWWPFDVVPGRRVLLRVGVADHLRLLVGLLPVWLGVLAARGRYRRLPVLSSAARVSEAAIGVSIALATWLALLFVLQVPTVSRTTVLAFGVASVPALLLAGALATSVSRRLVGGGHRVRVVGSDADAAPVLAEIQGHPEWGIDVVDRRERPDPTVADGVDEVMLVGAPDAAALSAVATACEEVGVALSFEVSFLGTRTARAELRDLDATALLTLSTTTGRGVELAAKRAIDVVGAAVGLVLFGGVVAFCALAVRWSDGGPALYVQERVGRQGRVFRLFKLRTMVVGADRVVETLRDRSVVRGPAFKLDDDPRVTRVGWWLRRLSLDELPQLYNVLRGEMSLVGPRPSLPDEVDRYARWQRRRLSMRPGLTGLWQVSARGEPDVERWIELDLRYIDRWSLWLDLGVLLRTVPAVLGGRGAR